MELAKVNSRGRSCTEVNAVPDSDSDPVSGQHDWFLGLVGLRARYRVFEKKKKTMKARQGVLVIPSKKVSQKQI